MDDIQRAQQVIDAAFPTKGFVVKEASKPFYLNSNRGPQKGDIVSIPGHAGAVHLFVYVETGRNVGADNAYHTNWVSLTYGHFDTGPVFNTRRTLLSSI